MDTDQSNKILTNGLFLGIAISSRFLLDFQDGALSQVVSFILLFGIYSAMMMWVKAFQKTLPEEKITLKQVISYTFKIFLIGAIASSIFKYIYFQHIKPDIFAALISTYDDAYSETVEKVNELLLKAKEANNTNDIAVYKEGINQLQWWKSVFINSYFQPFSSLIINLIGGLLLGWFIWPVFKINQQRKNSTPNINQ